MIALERFTVGQTEFQIAVERKERAEQRSLSLEEHLAMLDADWDAYGRRVQKTLNAKLRGHYQYYGRPANSQSLLKFYRGVVRIWRKWLNRSTRGNRLTRERYAELLRRHPLLPPRIRHGWT